MRSVRPPVKVIPKADVMPLLLGACPGFEPMWRDHLRYWGSEERGIFNDTGEFATYLVCSYARGETTEFGGAFDVVERLIEYGDEEARASAIVGVLESVQVQSTHHSFGPEPFRQWLGPLSNKAWSDIETVWEAGGGTLAGVIRNEGRGNDGGSGSGPA